MATGRSVPMGDMARHAAKIDEKRDEKTERAIQKWIEAVTGEPWADGELYGPGLKNGVYLCKLLNKLNPGAIKKVSETGGDFKMMENIANFCKAAKAYGVGSNDLFQTVDLWEKRNIPQVTASVIALSRLADSKGWSGPKLGI